jgi:hypothetical protein
MATLSTDNVKATAVQSFYEGLISPNDRVITDVCQYHDTDAAALRIAALTGIGDPTAWSGDLPTAAVSSTGAVTANYAAYGLSVELNPYDIRDIPDLVSMSAMKLGRSVANQRAKLAFALLANLFDDTAGTADGKGVCDNTHTTAAGTNRSNFMSSALDISSFNAAITKIRQWVNYQNQAYDWADVKKYLIVPPALEQIGRQILGSPYQLTTVTTSGSPSQGLMNTSGLFNTELIVDVYATDANNWSLVAEPAFGNPFHFWDRAKPDFHVLVEDQDSLKTKLRVTYASKAIAGPQPDGVMGASVS